MISFKTEEVRLFVDIQLKWAEEFTPGSALLRPAPPCSCHTGCLLESQFGAKATRVSGGGTL